MEVMKSTVASQHHRYQKEDVDVQKNAMNSKKERKHEKPENKAFYMIKIQFFL